MIYSARILVGLLLVSFISVNHSVARVGLRADERHSSSNAQRKKIITNYQYCDSWRFTVETNDAGKWSTVPKRCVEFVKRYVEGKRYRSDSNVVSDYAVTFAKSVNMSEAGKDAWVFDIDETLLSNLAYYRVHGYGSEPYNDMKFNNWVKLGVAPALPASRRLFYELKKLNFTIFLLTGRDESERSITEKNLHLVGYKGWKKLILRGTSDQGEKAAVYKSEKRKEIESAGYTIHGNSGDQWSDLTGYSVAIRSFKLPNPLYYIA